MGELYPLSGAIPNFYQFYDRIKAFAKGEGLPPTILPPVNIVLNTRSSWRRTYSPRFHEHNVGAAPQNILMAAFNWQLWESDFRWPADRIEPQGAAAIPMLHLDQDRSYDFPTETLQQSWRTAFVPASNFYSEVAPSTITDCWISYSRELWADDLAFATAFNCAWIARSGDSNNNRIQSCLIGFFDFLAEDKTTVMFRYVWPLAPTGGSWG